MFAEVIVDLSSGEVDRVFDYSFTGDLEAGRRVLVPFGGRETEGYVVGIKRTSDCPPDKIKSVIRPLDAFPVILPEMLALCDYMRERYNLRRADALRLFIPAQMRKGRVKELKTFVIALSPEFAGRDPSSYLRSGAKSQREIVEYLAEAGGAPMSELNRDFSAAALTQLRRKGIVTAEETAARRKPRGGMAGGAAKITLTPAQNAAADALDAGAGGKAVLLHGVTGSGKTEVYLNCIERALSRGKNAIMLVPEISLTPQVFGIFRERFGDGAAILHSGLSAGERFDEWMRLLRGEARVAVGARSAVFAPLKDLGLIIIDEEHDGSYVSENNPRYFTHDVALFRARANNCPLVLGSATPSIESYYAAEKGEYALLNLPERINKKPLPEMTVVDMRREIRDGNPGIFSATLLRELKDVVDGGRQAMIFINRRGHSSFVMCRSCGYTAKCAACDVSLTYHSEEELLKCHYCGALYRMLSECPECGSEHIRLGNAGTQKAARELSEIFPGARVLRMDNDTTRGKDAHLSILDSFKRGEAQILVGTQMIAKGHDFPLVTLVGILDADLSLHFSDYRASERTFQLVTQAAGRAGREAHAGKVVLQTYAPRHYVYAFAQGNDYVNFYKKERNLRECTLFPPFSVIVRAVYAGEDEAEIGRCFSPARAEIEAAAKLEWRDAFIYLRGSRCPVKRIMNKSRFQILARIRGERVSEIVKMIYNITGKYKSRGVTCFVELNPNNLD